MIIQRRAFITGLASLIASPAIVKASALMPVKSWVEPEIYRLTATAIKLRQLSCDQALFNLIVQMNSTYGKFARVRDIPKVTDPKFLEMYNEYRRLRNVNPS